jgi:hypothetical protein
MGNHEAASTPADPSMQHEGATTEMPQDETPEEEQEDAPSADSAGMQHEVTPADSAGMQHEGTRAGMQHEGTRAGMQHEDTT